MSRAFLGILVLSGLLEIGLALAFADIPLRYDEREFFELGRAIYATGSAPILWRAPGYQWFVAAGLALAGGRVLGVALLQVAASLATAAFTYRIGRRRWGERAGLLAGGFVALQPTRLAFTHLLWSETLYSLLVVAALERLLRADERRATGAAFVGGALLGAAGLTRSIGVGLAAVAALWLARGAPGRRGLALAGALAAGAALAVGPWSIYASAQAGRPVLVDTNFGYNLWSGSSEYVPDDLQGLWAVGIPLQNGLDARFTRFLPDDGWRDEVPYRMRRAGIANRFAPEGSDWYRDQALRAIAARPGAFLARVPLKLGALWAPDFFLPRHLLRDWYGPTPAGLAALLVALTWLASALPLLGGPVALGMLRGGDRFRSLALLWLAVYLAVHALFFGASRMHFPLVPILVLAVAAARWGGARSRLRRGAPWAALALAGWLLVAPAVAGLYVAPGPGHAGVARTLGALRHLPLPARRRVAWMLAGVEATRGEDERAARILAEAPWAEHPWSLFLRAQIARDGEPARRWLDRALARDPELFAALVTRARVRLRDGDPAGARDDLERARAVRPWDAAVRAKLRSLRRGQ